MANGFSTSALVGQKEFMRIGGIDHDQERTFLLSTTHGGETHSIAAAIATINEIKTNNLIEYFWGVGRVIVEGVNRIARELGAEKYIETVGFDVKPGFIYKDHLGQPSLVARTLFLQETISRGLIMPYLVPSFAHKKDDIDFALGCIGEALLVMKQAAEKGDMGRAIKGGVVKPVFRKFN
jgi:glutamate-1-semialdehyde 2,1-aminomutase